MPFRIKLFSFGYMLLKNFEAILFKISLKIFSKADAEDKNFNQKLYFVIQGIIKYSGSIIAGTLAPLIDFNKADYDNALKTENLLSFIFTPIDVPFVRQKL